jgi:hypothetical protein
MQGFASLLGLFAGTALDPVKIILGIGAGALTKGWLVLVIAPVFLTSLNELLLFQIQLTRSFDLGIFLISLVACGIWVSVGILARRFRNAGVNHG